MESRPHCRGAAGRGFFPLEIFLQLNVKPWEPAALEEGWVASQRIRQAKSLQGPSDAENSLLILIRPLRGLVP